MNKPQESATFNPRQVQEIRKLVSRGEGLHLEFKRKATYPEKIIREMIAFANTHGGVVLVGVNDDGALSGLKHPEDESHVILGALNLVRPALKFTETFIPIGESKSIIRYDIPESTRKPHYRVEGMVKEAFVRVADKSIQASREMREIIERRLRKKDIRFHYGQHEKLLMEYLDANPTITLNEFMRLSKLKRFYASKKMILLVLADVLKITPNEKGDLYSLGFRPESNGM